MTKLLRKTVFGLPSREVMERIDASAKAARIREVGYRFEAQLREFEGKRAVDELNGEE